jgi:hypothetical protein
VGSNLSRFRAWAKQLAMGLQVHRRTEFTVETDQILIIRRHSLVGRWCPECGREVDMTGQAEALLESAGVNLHDYVKSDSWHLCEGLEGTELICFECRLRKVESHTRSRRDDKAEKKKITDRRRL